MKKIRFRGWTDAMYQITPFDKFEYWSNLILGEGDRSLQKASFADNPFLEWLERRRWKKLIILTPVGASDVVFRVGFLTCITWQFGVARQSCKVSSVTRSISDGPFAMRMGFEDCNFFVIGNGSVGLVHAGYVEKDMDLY